MKKKEGKRGVDCDDGLKSYHAFSSSILISDMKASLKQEYLIDVTKKKSGKKRKGRKQKRDETGIRF